MNATRRDFVPAFAVLALLAAAFTSSCATRSRPEVVSHAESAENAESVCREGPVSAPNGVAVPLMGVLGMLRTGLVEDRPDALEMLLPHVAEAGKELATVEAYPDADEVSLFEWEGTRYETNGTYTTTWTSLSRILTQRGLENNRTFSFWNNDFYGSTTVLVARVFSPGGVARDIDLAANLAEAIDTGSLASNIHDPNDKTFTLALPGLQVGDSVALVMRRETRRPRCEGVYSDYLTFESDHPILFQGVRITGPASMPLRSRAFRDAGPVSLEHAAFTNEEAGTITEVWTSGETPRYFAEPDMPPAYDCTARLLLSTAPDWESLSRWYARLCAPHLAATNEAMALKVAELVASATGPATGVQGENAEPDGEAGPLREGAAERSEAGGVLRAYPDGEGRKPAAESPALHGVLPPAAGAATPLSEGGKLDGAPATNALAASVLAKLDGIVVPEIEFQSADICDIICYLGDCSREFDDEPEVAKRGVGFVLDLGGVASTVEDGERLFNDAAEPLSSGVPPVTIKEKNVSLREALDLVVETTDLKWRVENGHVLIVRKDDARGETFAQNPDVSTRADHLPPASRAAVVRALFDFVSREVRYMGAMAESEAPGYEPHDVSLTFDNRYGVCRDKAALLVAMLRMAGIDAWPVLINVGPRKDPQVPQPYFNHAIVAADSGDPDDPYLLMDPTSETTRSLLPEYLCEMSYLVARDEGEGIRETPPLPVEQNLLRAETVYTLHADASADVTTTLSFAGVNDAAYRGYFASIPRDGLRAFFERVLQGIPGAVLTGWEVRPAPEALRTSPEPLSVRLDYAIAEAARGAEDGRAALLDLPTVPAALAIASRVVGDLGLEKRRFPLVTDYPCGWEETVEIRLPDGVTLSPESAAERKPE